MISEQQSDGARGGTEQQTAAYNIIYANYCTYYAFQLLVTQYKLLSEEDFLGLHKPPTTHPEQQIKTLETVSLSLIPTTAPGSAFHIERGVDDKQVRVVASSEFRQFILRYSYHLQDLYDTHLSYGQPDERFWALLACAAAANLTRGLGTENAQFLISDEFKTVRGMLYELSRRIGYEYSGQQKELDDFFDASNRHKDLIARNYDHGFMRSVEFDGVQELYKCQLPLTQLLPDYTTVVGCNFPPSVSPFCVGEGPDLDDFLDETNYFVAVRTVNAFSCGVLDSVVRDARQSTNDSLLGYTAQEKCPEQRVLRPVLDSHPALYPQSFSKNQVQIPATALQMYRPGDKLLKNNGIALNQTEYTEPAYATKRFAEYLWAVQILARHVWSNVHKIRSKKMFEEYKKQIARCLYYIENEYAGNEFNTFVERSTIDRQISGVRNLLGIL